MLKMADIAASVIFESDSKQKEKADDHSSDTVPAQTLVSNETGPSVHDRPCVEKPDESCYRYEGDACIYRDPSSGVEYIYSADKNGWIKHGDSAAEAVDEDVHSCPMLDKCFYIGEHYCFRDASGRLYRLLSATNSWEQWSDPPDTDKQPQPSCPGDAAGDYFTDASGAWCSRDAATGVTYRWDEERQLWSPRTAGSNCRKHRPNRGSSDDSEHDTDEEESAGPSTSAADASTQSRVEFTYNEDGVAVYTDPMDGTKFEWDSEKAAWFPQVDEEFLALHSLNYGFDSDGRPVDAPPILQSAATAPPPPPPPPAAVKRARQMKTSKQPEWFELDEKKNSKVYVTGLPEAMTEEQFVEVMSKCGLVMKDAGTGKWRVKIYKDDHGVPKGDAVCTYIKVESVDLALRILDGYQLEGGQTLHVQRAQFSLRGDFNPKLKPKKRALKRKDREKLQKKQERLFAWQPDKIRGEREKHERVMVLKNVFHCADFKQQPQLILDCRQDIEDECAKYGDVRKVVVHDRNASGVVEVVFAEAAAADACISVMNGRWFAGRQITAHTWDGKTKYRVEETEEEKKERLSNWDKFIDGDSGDTTAAEMATTTEKQTD